MGDFEPVFSWSSSSATGKNNEFKLEFTCSTTPSVYGHNSRMMRRYKRSTKVNNGLKRSLDSTSSPRTFTFPPYDIEERTDEKNSKESSLGNGPTDDTNTKIPPPSAVPGVVPCYFEGSRYASNPSPSATTCYPSEKSIKMEKHDESKQESPSSQPIIKVSRILKGIPQSPHFWSLRGYSEVARQTLMDSWDHIFEETVDRIHNIKVHDFWVNASELWATLQELQGMGYNVAALRRRLVELTDVMLNMRTHKVEIRDLKSKVEKHMTVKSWLEYEIVKLRAQVETETAGYDAAMAKVAKMEDEVPKFNDIFAKLAIKAL